MIIILKQETQVKATKKGKWRRFNKMNLGSPRSGKILAKIIRVLFEEEVS